MKAYQRVLKRVSSVGIFVGLCLGLYFGIGFLTNISDADRELTTWCLDSGGRMVKIDGVEGCFQLTEFPMDSGMFGSPQSDCLADPTHIWHTFSLNAENRCYSFVRLFQEN